MYVLLWVLFYIVGVMYLFMIEFSGTTNQILQSKSQLLRHFIQFNLYSLIFLLPCIHNLCACIHSHKWQRYILTAGSNHRVAPQCRLSHFLHLVKLSAEYGGSPEGNAITDTNHYHLLLHVWIDESQSFKINWQFFKHYKLSELNKNSFFEVIWNVIKTFLGGSIAKVNVFKRENVFLIFKKLNKIIFKKIYNFHFLIF